MSLWKKLEIGKRPVAILGAGVLGEKDDCP